MSEDALVSGTLSTTSEPFLRSLLLQIYNDQLDELLHKTRIEIPANSGRLMMGTVDETGMLQYGQVYVRYSEDPHFPSVNTVRIDGTVVVTKCPCLHPGDLRTFDAVDVPALQHMVDCIVFPSVGPRPHPNEISGSDLDGDLYFVCWDVNLVPPLHENYIAMDFTSPEKVRLDHRITEIDMINFLCDYISNDQLGIIASAHVVHADAQKGGLVSKKCLDLAKLHSDAVDFVKTGSNPPIPVELRPMAYPHYTQKYDRPVYRSQHVLGKLYNQCYALVNNKEVLDPVRPPVVALDEELLYPGYKDFISDMSAIKDWYDVELLQLLSYYGIESEAVLIAGANWTANGLHGTLRREKYVILRVVRDCFQKLRDTVKEKLKIIKEPRCRRFTEDEMKKVSALYFLTYESSETSTRDGPRLLSLPWIFCNVLISIKDRRSANRNRTEADSLSMDSLSEQLHSVAITASDSSNMISISLSKQIVVRGNELLEVDQLSRATRIHAYKEINNIIQRTVIPPKPALAVIGSTVTGFDNADSSLDLCIGTDSDDDRKLLLEIVSKAISDKFSCQFKYNISSEVMGNAIILSHNGEDVRVRLFAEAALLDRTCRILSAIRCNLQLAPVIAVVLAWARKIGIIGNNRDCMLTAEQIICMFLQCYDDLYASNMFAPDDTILLLLKENHFVDCRITTCSHMQFGECIRSKTRYESDALLQFFQKFCTCSELSLAAYDFLHINLGDIDRLKLSRYMLKAHHMVARSCSIECLIAEPPTSNGRFIHNLSRQASGMIIFAEKHISERLQKNTKATVTIRSKHFRHTLPGLILEARGSMEHLEKLENELEIIENRSPMIQMSYASERLRYVNQCRKFVFEGYGDPKDRLVYDRYLGPRHDDDKCKHLFKVRLTANANNKSADEDQFVHLFLDRIASFKEKYDRTVHGSPRIVVSYGTIYLPSYNDEHRTVGRFLDKYYVRTDTGDAQYVDRMTGDRRPRSRSARYLRWSEEGRLRSNCLNASHTFNQQTQFSTPPSARPHLTRYQNPRPGSEFCPSDAYLSYSQLLEHHDTLNSGRSQHPRVELPAATFAHNFSAGFSYHQRESIGSGSSPDSSLLHQQQIQRGNPWRRPRSINSPQSRPSTRRGRQLRCTFYPRGIDSVDKRAEFEKSLCNYDFILTETKRQYLLTLNMESADYRECNSSVLVLDGNMNFVKLSLSEFHWLSLDVCRHEIVGSARPYDMRLRLQSRITMDNEDAIKQMNCRDLVNKSRMILQICSATGDVYDIHPEFRGRISFIRNKEENIYKCRMKCDDKFFDELEVRVNIVTTYLPNGVVEGVMMQVQDRIEISFIPPMPDVASTESCEDFAKTVWNFSRKLGAQLT